MGIIGCDIGVSDKVSSSSTPPPLQLADSSDGAGLGLKMQSTESYSETPSMMHHRPSSSPPSQQTAAGYECGPLLGCKSIYHDESAAVAVTSGGRAGVAAEVFAQRTLLQPFDISISNSNSTTAFKSPGGIGMAATLGFPFTAAQWKELERQAMIYKHMIASVPVPYDLLLPISPNLSANPALGGGGGGSIFSQLKYSGKQDPEPGRCKRTDGKKWRCSRDVAPHQKYCERHMHRGRPRSRKHVEIQTQSQNQENSQNQTNSKKGRLHSPNPNPNPPPPPAPQSNNQSSSPPKVHGSTILPNESPLLLNTKNTHISYKEPNRGLDWMMEGEMVTMDTSEQQWQQLMQQTNLGLTTEGSIYNTNQYYVEEPPLNLFSYTDFGGSQDFLSTDFVEQNPKGFIDAWSNNNLNQDDESNTTNKENSVSSNGNLFPSSLTLSMAMGSLDGNYQKQGHVSSLMNPVSWVGSTPGGPLAEVLRPSAVAIDSNRGSPYAGNGDQISPPATTVSSPSGVLQRNMLSLSDSSVCKSPTLATTTARPDIVAFQWLS